jgi:hypothetical protein
MMEPALLWRVCSLWFLILSLWPYLHFMPDADCVDVPLMQWSDSGLTECSVLFYVQYEDVFLCEAVQKGLASGMFESGRYVAPQEEAPYHFHRLIHADLAAYEGTA